ncbi:MAG: 50S ribosomal protein L29 [Patescibacteria group bacterium]
MDYADLKSKDVEELQKMAEDLKIKLGKFRFELANKTLKNFDQLGQTKKDIARVLTAIQKQKIVASK